MNLSNIYIAMALSVVLSLIVEEKIGLSTGGLVVPAALALNYSQPSTILFLLAVSILDYLIVTKVLDKHMILFRSRRLAVSLVLALAIEVLIARLVPGLSLEGAIARSLALLTPAFLAEAYKDQGLAYTILPCGGVSLIIGLVLSLV